MQPTRTTSQSQRGIATLLFITFVGLALAAASAVSWKATQGAQRVQHAGHTATQAEMSAWAGVTLLSHAVAAMPSGATLTPGEAVKFTGAQPGVSAKFIGVQDTFLVFEVTGASAGAHSIVKAAYRRPAAPGSSASVGNITIPAGMMLTGRTELSGSVSYTGDGPPELYVLDGSLTMGGSVSGLERVCATGDVSLSASVTVGEICSNGNVSFSGSASVTTVKAIGNVTLSGGATSAIGTIHSNGTVTLSGGSATAGRVYASGNVSVTGGSARADDIATESSIDWSSKAVAEVLAANGTVDYRPSGSTVATDITAIGNVTLTSARNVRTKGATTLVGYYGQGITGTLDGEGLLGGSSWGKDGGAVVKAGTVGSIVSPHPKNVNVTVTPGHAVAVTPVVVPVVPAFARPRLTVDAYALRDKANFAFNGVDGKGNPRVTVRNISGVADGDYFIADNAGNKKGKSAGANYLCKTVSGTECAEPLVKVCQGYSDTNRCFSYNDGDWEINGTTALPAVFWFEGDLKVGNGTWVGTFLATGDVSTGGNTKVYAPNYPPSTYSCGGAADNAHNLSSWTSHGFSTSAYATQLCAGATPALTGATIGNVALLAGGFSDGAFTGGNVTLGASTKVYGVVLAGQYLTTGGETTVAGALYSAAQGGSTAKTFNKQGGTTMIRIEGGSSAYDGNKVPCMADCAQEPSTPASNIVWAAPA